VDLLARDRQVAFGGTRQEGIGARALGEGFDDRRMGLAAGVCCNWSK